MGRTRRWLGLAALAALALLPACGTGSGGASGASTPGRMRVVATTTQTADFARIVGGDQVTVYDVVKANVDPHDFEPSPADLEAIRKARVIVQNGVGLEAWFDDVLRSAGSKGSIVDASTGITIRRNGAESDPHVWHDPRNATKMVTTIEAAFIKADPVHEADYRKRADDYGAALVSLDGEIKAQVDSLANKKLVTNHDAFGYYVDRYGLEFVGSIIPSFDTSAELSAKVVDDLVAKIKATGVKAVFSESSLPPKTADAIGGAAGVRVVAGESSLYGDSLGPPGSDGATYLDMMRHNTRVIVDNLR